MIALWRQLGRPGARTLALAVSLSVLSAVFGIALMGLSGWFLAAAAGAGAAGAVGAFNHLYPSTGVRAFAIARVLSRYGEQLVGHDATLKISASIRTLLFERLARGHSGLAPVPAGELAAIVDDVSAVEGGFLKVVSPVLAVVAAMLVAIGWTVVVSPLLAAGIAATFLASGVCIPIILLARIRRQAAQLAEEQASIRSEIGGIVENAVELEICGVLGDAMTRAGVRLNRIAIAQDRLQNPFRITGALISLAGGLSSLAVIACTIAVAGDGAVAAGAALAVVAAFEAMAASARILDVAASAYASTARLSKRLQPAGAEAGEQIAAGSVLPLRLRSACVPLDGAHQVGPVSLDCMAGDIIALSGRSGSGKTTTLEAIASLRTVSDGVLTYADAGQATVRPASVLARIAIAPQFPGFLPGTLYEQLAYGRPDATGDEIRRALAIVGMEPVVAGREGEDATLFSGGERRRLGIARALLANPELLLLDEPFAGLEEQLAERIRANLARWVAGERRAIIFTSHAACGDWGDRPVRVAKLASPETPPVYTA